MSDTENDQPDPNEFLRRADELLDELEGEEKQRDYLRALLMHDQGRLAEQVENTIDLGNQRLDHDEDGDQSTNAEIIERLGRLTTILVGRADLWKDGETWVADADLDELDKDEIARDLKRFLAEFRDETDDA